MRGSTCEQITVGWHWGNGATGYNIYRSLSNTPPAFGNVYKNVPGNQLSIVEAYPNDISSDPTKYFYSGYQYKWGWNSGSGRSQRYRRSSHGCLSGGGGTGPATITLSNSTCSLVKLNWDLLLTLPVMMYTAINLPAHYLTTLIQKLRLQK